MAFGLAGALLPRSAAALLLQFKDTITLWGLGNRVISSGRQVSEPQPWAISSSGSGSNSSSVSTSSSSGGGGSEALSPTKVQGRNPGDQQSLSMSFAKLLYPCVCVAPALLLLQPLERTIDMWPERNLLTLQQSCTVP